jgi:hypothetical protein
MKTKKTKKQDSEDIKTATTTDVNTAFIKGFIAGIRAAIQPPEKVALLQQKIQGIIGRNKSQD